MCVHAKVCGINPRESVDVAGDEFINNAALTLTAETQLQNKLTS